MNVLTYRCPHCRSNVDVAAEMVGETIFCPEADCGHPIELLAQPAKLVASSEELPASPLTASPLAATDADAESELVRRHPAMFRKRPAVFLGLLILGGAGVWGALEAGRTEHPELAWVGWSAAGAVALVYLAWWVRVLHTTLIATTRRIILRQGIFAKATNEVRHADIRNLQVDQGILDRVFRVGDLAASSAGQDGIEIRAWGIPEPQEIVEIVRAHQGAG